jgi:anti-sigma factor RsiW
MSSNPPNHVPDDAFHLYLDGELAEHRRMTVEKHLEQCGACLQRFEVWRDLYSQLERLPETPLERDLTGPVLAAIQSPRRARAQWGVWLVQGAAIVLLLIFGTTWVRQGWRQIAVRVPIWTASEWLEGALVSAMRLLRSVENLLASIGPALMPDVSEWPVVPAADIWIWALLIGGGLLGIVGNRWLLLRGARSDRRA